LDIFKVLIETHGADINLQDNIDDTPLHYAIRYYNPSQGGDIAVLMYLLNQKGVNVNIEGRYGYTLLHTACDNINTLPIDIYKVLIETHGCNINAQDRYDNTPLHIALFNFDPNQDGGEISVLQYLLNQKNVDVNIKGQNDTTLFHVACININNLLLDVFEVLMETLGCDVNVQDNYNNIPLHNALH
jgi:ankyrin repeat protein